MINGSKISVHRFIATMLFCMAKGWPHSSGNIDKWQLNYKIIMCGHPLAIRNSVVAIKRWTEILLPLIIIIIAPLRVEHSLNLFLHYSSSGSLYSAIPSSCLFYEHPERKDRWDIEMSFKKLSSMQISMWVTPFVVVRMEKNLKLIIT